MKRDRAVDSLGFLCPCDFKHLFYHVVLFFEVFANAFSRKVKNFETCRRGLATICLSGFSPQNDVEIKYLALLENLSIIWLPRFFAMLFQSLLLKTGVSVFVNIE